MVKRHAASKRYAVVLSDLHIGDNTPTCWFQAAVHRPYLERAIAWIVKRREVVREVVLLGDVFDVWTYPPWVPPPTMREIIAANGSLLGPSGPFAALVKALPGEVRMLLGNHDGTLTRADVDLLNASLGGNRARGEAITLVPGEQRIVGVQGARTVLSHGHYSCMFNAPDPDSAWGRLPPSDPRHTTLPVGHFVSRAIAYSLARTLGKDETAADKLRMGNPAGIDVRSFVASMKRNPNLVELLLDYVCKTTGMPPGEKIVLPSGRTTSVNEAKLVYRDLFARWVAKEKGRRWDAERAAMADWKAEDLAWFAQRHALRTASDLAVMGHTHVPVAGLKVSPVQFVNSGYACPSKPDMARGIAFTFAQIDVPVARAQVLQLPRGGGDPAPAKAPRIDVLPRGAMDFSCYVRIENRTGRRLELVAGSVKALTGHWVVPPPSVIEPGKRVDAWLQDELGTHGASGRFSYEGVRRLDFVVRCPFAGLNAVVSPVPVYETKTANRPWRKRAVDRSGHPLQVRFAVEPARAPAPARPPAPAPPRVRRPAPLPLRTMLWDRLDEDQRRIAIAHTDYLSVARLILAEADGRERRATGRVQYSRGTVMSFAKLAAHDGSALMDETTKQVGASRRLSNPLAHVIPDVFRINSPQYGPLDYVFLRPNEPTAPPAGAVFLPRRGSIGLNVVTWTVEREDKRYVKRCRNDYHAELQLTNLIDRQPPKWQAKLGALDVVNGSRRRTGGVSPCNACCHDLANHLTKLNALRQAAAAGHPSQPRTVAARISWTRLYTGPRVCPGWTIDRVGYGMLVASGWHVPADPRPPGAPRPPTGAPAPAPAPAGPVRRRRVITT